MSETTLPQPTLKSESTKTPFMTVVVPHLVAIGAQLPLLFLYLRDLWNFKPHYQFIPFALGVVIFLAWQRWPRDSRLPYQSSKTGDVFLVLGLLVGLLNCLFLETWPAAVSCMLLATSLFARTYDSLTGKTLIALSLPLLVCIVPPKRGDMWVITKLQRISASFTSQLLDVVGYAHHMPGTVINAPGGKGFGIAEACSGVQSFFTLLFVAVAFAVWNRRPWFRTTLLMISAIFWAIFMNTVRIFTIPMADRLFGINLSDGVAHMLLGYTTLAIGILLLFSTDQFLLFLFGPIDEESSESRGLGKWISKSWNKVISGAEDNNETEKRKKRTRRQISNLSGNLILGAAGLLLLGGLWQFYGVGQSLFSTSKKVRFFESIITQPMEREDLPAKIGDWQLVDGDRGYEAIDREAGNDLGLHSDRWVYASPSRFPVIVSLDQTFPGWHELTVCYQNQGWKLKSRKKKTVPMLDDESKNWSYIEAEYEKETGEQGFLIFSLFDVFGDGYDAPGDWDTLDYYAIHLKNRLSHRIRAQLFRGETYQTQAFVETYIKLTDAEKADVAQNYLKLRDQMRKKFLEHREKAEGSGQ